MKIVLVCFLHLDELPPMMTVLKVLSEKYSVVYYGIDDYKESYKKLFGDNVEFINVWKQKNPEGKSIYAKFRRLLYKWRFTFRAHSVTKEIENVCNKEDLLWIHHEFTLLHLRTLKHPYILTMYELHESLFKKKSRLKKLIFKSKKVVVPEYARAAIVQACAGLEKLPLVIPNKPYDYENLEVNLDDNLMKEIVNKAHACNKKVVLYSGIFLRERKMDTFIKAIVNNLDKYELVLVGRESDYLSELLERYPVVKYLGFFEPPYHLSVVKQADIGILTYVSDSGSINPVFCAPNKIWEYARFGIPMICNNIPGLKYSVEYEGMGFCCDINSVQSISDTLDRISENYMELSEHAIEYYNKVNIEKAIMGLVEEQ